MRIVRFLLATALVCQLLGVSHAQTDGQCTVPLDISEYAELADEILLDAEVEFGIAAPLMSTSPVADGMLGDGEYANSCYFTFAENENPGHSWPTLDNLDDGDEDLTLTMHFAHTADHLFVAYEVYDDYLELDEGANSFQNDGVELFVNPDLDVGDGWGPGRFQIYVDAAGEGDVEFNNRGASAGIVPALDNEPFEGEFYSAGLVNADESGYVVELMIPLGSIDTTGGDDDLVPVQTGDFIMINAAIDDNDEEDDPAGQNGHHLLWHVDGANSPFGAGEAVWTVPLELTPEDIHPTCDVDRSGTCDAADIDALTAAIAGGETGAQYDINGDGSVNASDRTQLINVEFNTYVGDSNLDGEFSSSDFVAVFGSAKYETGQEAGWAEGDWNGDNLFNSSDFVAAFSAGAYEQGPRAPAAVPEPSSMALITLALGGLGLIRRRR